MAALLTGGVDDAPSPGNELVYLPWVRLGFAVSARIRSVGDTRVVTGVVLPESSWSSLRNLRP